MKKLFVLLIALFVLNSLEGYGQINGSTCDMIYVDGTNGSDSNQGTAANPVETLSRAMSMVSPSRNYIKMTTGTYAENTIINLQDGLIIDGRYTNNNGVWSKSSNTAASTSITLSGEETIDDNVAHVMGFKSDGKSNWKLIDLNIATVNASGNTSSRNGMSNYAVYIANGSANYEITRCDIVSGNASNGQGRNTHASLFNGGNGGNGSVGSTGLAGSRNSGFDAGGAGGIGGAGGTGGFNQVLGVGAQSGYNGGNGGSGRNDNNTGGYQGSPRTGTCIEGTNPNWGGNGSDCTSNGANGANATTITLPYYVSGYYLPGYGSSGEFGRPGGGGAGGTGGNSYRPFLSNYGSGGGGSGGSGGGGGGGAGAGGRGGGSSYGIFIWNAGTGGVINNSIVNTGVFGSKGTGGLGGNGGIGGVASAQGASGYSNQQRGGRGGAGSNGGKGGNGADGTDGERIAIAVRGGGTNPTFNNVLPAIAINTSPSGGTVLNSPIVSLNEIPNKICQNSVLNIETTAASWALPNNWEFVKYNNSTSPSEFTTGSTTADITTSNISGFYDLTANGVVFNSYLNVRSERELPVITVNPSPICDGETINLSATSWGTETDYKWEIFDATDAPDKGLTTGLVYSSTDENPTGITLTASTSPKTYIIRYQVYEECCGWSVPVFEVITVNPHPTPPTASTGGGNYCHGNRITLTQSGGTDGTGAVNVWYAASGETSPDPNSCNNEGFIELWNDFKYNDPNCYYNHHSTDYNVNNGILEVDVTGPDPFIWMYPLPGNVTIDADEYKYINVRYRVTNYVNNGVSHQPRMGVLFTKREHCDPYGYPTGYYPFSDSQYEPGSERKEINADGQWHIVSIPINNSANWHGTITGLRLDYFDPYPHEGNIGSSMEIDFLIVSKHPMIGEGKSITLSPGDEYYPTETTTYYAKKIDNCGATLCVDETVVLPPIGTTLSNNNESATCVVNANEFIHFYHTSGRFLGSINANGGNLGNVTMTTFVGAPAYMEDCNQPGHSSFHTAYMGRRWIMNSDIYTNGSDFGNNVSVRLPYNNSELVALNNFAQTDTPNNPFDGGTIDPQATRQNMMLTKITGATEDGNATQADCTGTIRGIANGGNGINPEGISNTEYIDFSIQQFSEFFLHKHQDNSPLPVELTNLSASCNKEVQINWTTASEKNSERFVVEKSRDGQTWTFVSEEQAAGNSTTTISYTVIDTQPSGGISYYRLRQVDFDGKEKIYGPISVSCDGISNSMVVYPNPNDGTFVVEITTDKAISDAELQLFDITGKIISAQHLQIPEGITQVSIDKKAYLKPGTYVLKVIADVYFEPVKIVVK